MHEVYHHIGSEVVEALALLHPVVPHVHVAPVFTRVSEAVAKSHSNGPDKHENIGSDRSRVNVVIYYEHYNVRDNEAEAPGDVYDSIVFHALAHEVKKNVKCEN